MNKLIDKLVDFPRRPKEHEEPSYEPMMKWMDAVERGVRVNRFVMTGVCITLIITGAVGTVSLVMRIMGY